MTEPERLVRDRVPERLRERGREPTTHTVEGERYRELLIQRAHAALVAYEERDQVGDLADVLEVVYTLAAEKGVDPEAVEAARAERQQRRGGFEEGVVLEAGD